MEDIMYFRDYQPKSRKLERNNPKVTCSVVYREKDDSLEKCAILQLHYSDFFNLEALQNHINNSDVFYRITIICVLHEDAWITLNAYNNVIYNGSLQEWL